MFYSSKYEDCFGYSTNCLSFTFNEIFSFLYGIIFSEWDVMQNRIPTHYKKRLCAVTGIIK